MPITITQEGYARACGVVRNTACARLKNVHPIGTEKPFKYHLASVLPTTRREGIPELFSLAEVSDDLFVGDNVLTTCRRFDDWLNRDERRRLLECQFDFTDVLVLSMSSSVIFTYIDPLRNKLALHPGVLRYVVLSDATGLPNWRAFTVDWAIANVSHVDPRERLVA